MGSEDDSQTKTIQNISLTSKIDDVTSDVRWFKRLIYPIMILQRYFFAYPTVTSVAFAMECTSISLYTLASRTEQFRNNFENTQNL